MILSKNRKGRKAKNQNTEYVTAYSTLQNTRSKVNRLLCLKHPERFGPNAYHEVLFKIRKNEEVIFPSHYRNYLKNNNKLVNNDVGNSIFNSTTQSNLNNVNANNNINNNDNNNKTYNLKAKQSLDNIKLQNSSNSEYNNINNSSSNNSTNNNDQSFSFYTNTSNQSIDDDIDLKNNRKYRDCNNYSNAKTNNTNYPNNKSNIHNFNKNNETLDVVGKDSQIITRNKYKEITTTSECFSNNISDKKPYTGKKRGRKAKKKKSK